MCDEIRAVDVLDWLYRWQKKLKIDYGRAECKPHVTQSELDAIERKLAYIDFMIGELHKRI